MYIPYYKTTSLSSTKLCGIYLLFFVEAKLNISAVKKLAYELLAH